MNFLLSILTFSPLALAHAHPKEGANSDLQRIHAATETWHIPRLDYHLMTSASGVPGGEWPEGAKFPTAISFDMRIPYPLENGASTNATAKCSGHWTNGSLPRDESWGCAMWNADSTTVIGDGFVGGVRFSVEPWRLDCGSCREEMWFKLNVVRDAKSIDGSYYGGNISISCNDPANEPTSWLMCTLGRPLDGLRCSIWPRLGKETMLIVANNIESE